MAVSAAQWQRVGRDGHAKLGQFAVNAPVTRERVFSCQADGEPSDSPDRRRPARLAAFARIVFPGGEPAVPGQQRRGRHREDLRPAPVRDEPREHREPGPVGGLVPYPAGVPAQHRVLVPEHQQLGVLRAVPADHQDSQAEQPAHHQADDLHQHLASQPLPHRPRRRHGRASDTIEFPSGTGPAPDRRPMPGGRLGSQVPRPLGPPRIHPRVFPEGVRPPVLLYPSRLAGQRPGRRDKSSHSAAMRSSTARAAGSVRRPRPQAEAMATRRWRRSSMIVRICR
jgi:hypothetical protein